MKIKITKEQARILENLNTGRVIKITQSQYKQLLESEGVDENALIKPIYNAIAKVDGKAGAEYKRNVSSETKIKGVLHEDLWKEFVNELYGLNESGKNIYEKLIKVMEVAGYVENRKLSKTAFEGDKDLAKNVILSGLAKLHECGSAYMAMEAMEEAFKSEKKNPFFKGFVDTWFAKGNENNMVKKYYDDGEYWLAWQMTRRIGDVGKAPQSQEDMEVVTISEVEEPNGVVGLDILNHPPFSNLPETRSEMGDYTTRMEPRLPSLETPDASTIIFSKEDFVDHEFQGPKMMHKFDGYVTLFKKKFGEEPIFINIKDEGRRGSADIANEKFIEWRDRGLASKRDWMDAERGAGKTSGLDEIEVDEVTMTASSGQYTTGASFLEPMKNETKIYEALNALKKKITDESEEEIEEATTTVSAGPLGYATPGFAPSEFMGTAGKKGKAPVNTKKKIPTWPGGSFVEESAFDKTQWAGGSFVEFDDCTKLNNNKEAQKGGCSTGAIDNVVKLKKTASNVNAPSLGKKQQ